MSERETSISAEERETWRERLNRMMLVVSDPRSDGNLLDPNSGTGVIVRIADREFVFTAGHVVDGVDRKLLTLVFRNPNLSIPSMPGKDVRDLWFTPGNGRQAPDVCAIELEPQRRQLWRHYEALTLDDLGDWTTLAPSTRVLVAGYPAVRQEVTKNDVPQRIDEGNVRTVVNHRVTSVGTSLVTLIRREVTDNDYAPLGSGRFHVGWERVIQSETGDEHERIAPRGVSGGPVIAIDGARPISVGVVRSSYASRFLLCEPIVEVLKLLQKHPVGPVRAEIRHAIERLSVPIPT